MLQAMNEIKAGKGPGPSEVSIELIAACLGVGIDEMAEICHRVLDLFGMPIELTRYSGANLQGEG